MEKKQASGDNKFSLLPLKIFEYHRIRSLVFPRKTYYSVGVCFYPCFDPHDMKKLVIFFFLEEESFAFKSKRQNLLVSKDLYCCWELFTQFGASLN